MRILLVEDDAITARILKSRLDAMGHEVIVATDGIAAWQMTREHHIPIIISDWMMPGLDGPSLCRSIRATDDLRYTYFILLTAKDGRADRMEGLRAGADDFLVKPADAEELTVKLEVARRIIAAHDQLERQNSRLFELATTDELTGLANRRELFRMLEVNFELAIQQDLPLSLILADVDHFKVLNDTFGHPAGDDALRAFASILRSNCHAREIIARHGGEEFAVLLLGVGRGDALAIAEQFRSAISGREWDHSPLTASFGISTNGPDVADADDLVAQADAALYFSKRSGRDRVTHYDSRSSAPSQLLCMA